MVLNLSNQELFFPEKRPFFTEGLELFQPVGAEFGAPMQLFYSRRIGLDAPILAAAKVTGTGWKGLDLGHPGRGGDGRRRPRQERRRLPRRPRPRRRLGPPGGGNPGPAAPVPSAAAVPPRPEQRAPREPPVSRNYFAAVVRQSFLGDSSVGADPHLGEPARARCTQADIEHQKALQAALPLAIRVNTADPIRWDRIPVPRALLNDCQAYGGTTAGLDFNLRSRTASGWRIGTVLGSRRIGGPADDVPPGRHGDASRQTSAPAGTSSPGRSAARDSAGT